MKKFAKNLKKGDKIEIAGQMGIIEDLEISEIGKQGKSKVRIAALMPNKEKIVIIRPEDYPFDCN